MHEVSPEQIVLIEEYLKRSFRKPRRGLLGRITREPKEFSYRLTDTVRYPASIALSSTVVWAAVNEPYLDRVDVPTAKSWGLFALYCGSCFHLNVNRPGNFAKLMQLEKGAHALTAGLLSSLLCDAVLSRKDERWVRVDEVDAVVRWIPRHPDVDRYLSICAPLLTPASKRFKDGEARIEFTAASIFAMRILSFHRVTLSLRTGGAFSHKSEIIAAPLRIATHLRYCNRDSSSAPIIRAISI